MLWKPNSAEWRIEGAAGVWLTAGNAPKTFLGTAAAAGGLAMIASLFAGGVPETMERIAFPLVLYGAAAAFGLGELAKRFAGSWPVEARWEEDAVVVADNRGKVRRIPYAEIAHADFAVPVPNTGRFKAPTLTLSSASEKKLLTGAVTTLEGYKGLLSVLEARGVRIVAPIWAEESFEARCAANAH